MPPPPSGGYGAYNAYVTTRYAALGAPTAYDYPSSVYGSMFSCHVGTVIPFCIKNFINAYQL